jgi:L-malate glycosyltransferase
MKKILFVTPYFGRSGSEMQLFYLLQQLDKTKYKPYLFSRDNGVLLKQLPKNIEHFVGYKQHNNYLYRLLRLLLYAVGVNPTEFQLRILQWKLKPDFWYINTIVNRDAVNIATKLKVKFVSHFHELPFSYSLVKYNTIEQLVLNATHSIGCSNIVCEKLKDMGCKNVSLLYGFVNMSNIVVNKPKEAMRQMLGFNNADFVWVISGFAHTTKGVDFLVPLLKKLNSHHKIIWLGPIDKRGVNFYVNEAIKNLFADRVFFLGEKSNDYYDYFNAVDGFLSLSREDSFPLVMIEAAHLGKPILGFNSGGIKEFVSNKIGRVVGMQDFETLAEAMEHTRLNPNYYNLIEIKQHAATFNPADQAKKLEKILDSIS